MNSSYEKLYSELYERAELLHESNKRRIRRGLISLVLLPVVLGIILRVTESSKIVFLIIWIICMFVICAYLITVEYLDDSVLKTLEKVTDEEAQFDDLLQRPDLPELMQRRNALRERIRGRVLERITGMRGELTQSLIADDHPDTSDKLPKSAPAVTPSAPAASPKAVEPDEDAEEVWAEFVELVREEYEQDGGES